MSKSPPDLCSHRCSLTEELGNATKQIFLKSLSLFELSCVENWQRHSCFHLSVIFLMIFAVFPAQQWFIFVPFALAALTLRWDSMVWRFSPTPLGVTTCWGRLTPGWIWSILPQQRSALLYFQSFCFKNEKSLSIWTVILSNSDGDKNKATSVHYTVKKLLCHCNLPCFAYI